MATIDVTPPQQWPTVADRLMAAEHELESARMRITELEIELWQAKNGEPEGVVPGFGFKLDVSRSGKCKGECYQV